MKKFSGLGVRQAVWTVLLGVTGLWVGPQEAIAAETVVLELSSGELTITIDELGRYFKNTKRL